VTRPSRESRLARPSHRGRTIAITLLVAAIMPALIVWAGTAPAAAQEQTVPVTELLTAPARYDGAVITIEGELVGDYGYRASGIVWTQLNDDSYVRAPLVEGGALTGANTGVGLRIPAAEMNGLSPPGGYRIRGPIVRATGQWRFHDPNRQGETYLDVASLEVIESGKQLEEGPNGLAVILGAVLVLAAGATLAQRRYARMRA